MKRVVEQPVSPGGNIDALLGAFFKGEMPQPWPAFAPPQRQATIPLPRAKPRPRFAVGSRLALAASVLMLLLCGWLLCDQFPELPPSTGSRAPIKINPGDADKKHRKPPIIPSGDPSGPGHKQHEPPVLAPRDLIPRIQEAVPGKVESNLRLEQDVAGTSIRADVKAFSSRR